MKRLFVYIIITAFSLALLLPGESFGAKVKGTYKGKGVARVSGCDDRDDNGKYKFKSTVKITKQSGGQFQGRAYNRLRVGSARIKEKCDIYGTVKGRRLRGDSYCDLYINGSWDSSSAGTWKAKKKGKKLYIKGKDHDTSGDTCTTRIKVKLKKK